MGLGEMVKLVKIGALICSILLFSMVPARAEYLIDVGDTLEISVAGMPELRQRVVVQLDGSISYPLLGTARVGIRDSNSRRAGRRRPAQTGTGNLPWLDEVQDLAREPDVCIGAHSISHPVLAKCDRLTAMQEIAESKAHLERRLGKPVRHLAYPFGDPGAVGAREFDLARQGWVSDSGNDETGSSLPRALQSSARAAESVVERLVSERNGISIPPVRSTFLDLEPPPGGDALTLARGSYINTEVRSLVRPGTNIPMPMRALAVHHRVQPACRI